MNTLSRRSFLQLAGVTLATVPLSRFAFLSSTSTPNQGRALLAAPIFQTPSAKSEAVSHLWPDSMISLLDVQNEWYLIPDGFVSRTAVQPMNFYSPNDPFPPFSGSFWAEVAGPVASVRSACAANAPLVTRIGHGGVLQVVDFLPGEPNGWYGVADEQGQFLGWSQAVFWREVSVKTSANQEADQRQIQINRGTCQLSALENGEMVLQADCAVSETLQPGYYIVQTQHVSGRWQNGSEDWQGIPWQTTFGEGYAIAGAYWHNRFGEALPGPAVQTPPALAKWLYCWVNDQTCIVVT